MLAASPDSFTGPCVCTGSQGSTSAIYQGINTGMSTGSHEQDGLPPTVSMVWTAYVCNLPTDHSQRWHRRAHFDIHTNDMNITRENIRLFGEYCASISASLDGAREARTGSAVQNAHEEGEWWRQDLVDAMKGEWVGRTLGVDGTAIDLHCLSVSDWVRMHPDDTGVNTSGRFSNTVTIKHFHNGKPRPFLTCRKEKFNMGTDQLNQLAADVSRYRNWKTTDVIQRDQADTATFSDAKRTLLYESVLAVWDKLSSYKPSSFSRH